MRPLRMFVIVASLITGACTVGPNYKRPPIVAPPQFRADTVPAPAPASLGDAKWFEVFRDEKLQALIKTALESSYDIKIAAARVLEARGSLTATKSGLWPQIDAAASANRQGAAGSGISSIFAGGQAIWEIDLFGKLRRATEAARAELLATELNQLVVRQALVSDVATAYFRLREADKQLEVAREALVSREVSLKLVIARSTGGVATQLETDQARSLVATAAATIALAERDIEQTENFINLLLGLNPGPVERGDALTAQVMPPDVPAGLPSSLLERRPDLRATEQMLVAANARIGVAKAAFFPSITLTGGGGYQSFDLANVVTRNGAAFNYGAAIDLPIFDAGRRVGNYNAAKARQEQALYDYQSSVTGAFREVSDALIGVRKAREYRVQQELFATTLRDQSRLSTLRYRGGVTSYLEVLDSERQLLSAEQLLAEAQRNELVSAVTLYKVLGGGWQQ
jgi:outer membrane protein, multidrug efflux system